jgi:hypothetical protein
MTRLAEAASLRMQADTAFAAVRQAGKKSDREWLNRRQKAYELTLTALAELDTGKIWCAEALRALPELGETWAGWQARLAEERDKLTRHEQSLALVSKVEPGPHTPRKDGAAPVKPAMRTRAPENGKAGVRFQAPAGAGSVTAG